MLGSSGKLWVHEVFLRAHSRSKSLPEPDALGLYPTHHCASLLSPNISLRGPSILLVFLPEAVPKLTTGTQFVSVEVNWNALNDSMIPFPNCNWHFGAYHTKITEFELLPSGILLLASLTMTGSILSALHRELGETEKEVLPPIFWPPRTLSLSLQL